MSGLGFWDKAIAGAAAGFFRAEPKVGRYARVLLLDVGTLVVCLIAASRLDGWVVFALYLVALRSVYKHLFIGLADRVLRERRARLELISPVTLAGLRRKTVLYSRQGGES